MLITVTGGWTENQARNELDLKVEVVGADAQEVAHLESLTQDDWTVEGVTFGGGKLTMDVKASRKVTLSEQAEIKAAADKAAAEDAAVKAKADADALAAKAANDARVQGLAAVAAKAAVDAVLAAEKAANTPPDPALGTEPAKS